MLYNITKKINNNSRTNRINQIVYKTENPTLPEENIFNIKSTLYNRKTDISTSYHMFNAMPLNYGLLVFFSY